MTDRGLTRRTVLGHLAALGVLTGQDQGPDHKAARTVRESHPRLILLDSDLPRRQALIRDNAQARKIQSDLERDAERILTMPPLDFRAGSTGSHPWRLLNRVYLFGLLYRLEHRTIYLDRALREMRVAANLKDWSSPHFPDTAVMTHALAIGYDWLWQELKEAERTLLREAISSKGLDPAFAFYQRQTGWVVQSNNANVVCNSGIGIGALAIAESEPEKSAALLEFVEQSIQRGLAAFAPDGGWSEGAAYWHSTSQSAAAFLASLETAGAGDAGLSSIRGLDRAGRFRVYLTGPTGRPFNFADANDDTSLAPELFWMARRYGQPAYAWQEQRSLERSPRAEPLDLIWFYRDARPPQPSAWPLDSLFVGVQCAFFRSSWDDPNALFLAVKGGDNKAFHAHMDLGSFVLDALGVRWALDFGPDNYDLPGYFGKQRQNYHRVRTEAHNTLIVDGEGQDPRAEARIAHHDFGTDLSWVTIDLSKAYSPRIKLLERRIGMAQRRAVIMQDRLRADAPTELAWGMITSAEISLEGQTATLSKDSARLKVEIRTPRHAVFDVVTTQPPTPQSQNRGTQKLVVRLEDKVTEVDLTVVLTPYRAGQTPPAITVSFPA